MNRVFLSIAFLIFFSFKVSGQCSSPANTILGFTKYCEGDKLVLKMSDTTQRLGSAWQTPTSEFFNTDSIVFNNVSELDKGSYYLYSGIGNCRKTTKVEVTIFKEGTNSNLLEISELANNGNYCQGNLFKITAELKDKAILNNFETKIIYNDKDEIPFKIGDTLKTYNKGTYRVESKGKSCVLSSDLLNIKNTLSDPHFAYRDPINIKSSFKSFDKIIKKPGEKATLTVLDFNPKRLYTWYKDGIELVEFKNKTSIVVVKPGEYKFKVQSCDLAKMSEGYVVEDLQKAYISFDKNDTIGKSHTVYDTIRGYSYPIPYPNYNGGQIFKNGKFYSSTNYLGDYLYYPGIYTFDLGDYLTTDTLVVLEKEKPIIRLVNAEIDLCLDNVQDISCFGNQNECKIYFNDVLLPETIIKKENIKIGTYKISYLLESGNLYVEKKYDVKKSESFKIKFNPGVGILDNQVFDLCNGSALNLYTNVYNSLLFKNEKIIDTLRGNFKLSEPGTYYVKSNYNNCEIKSNTLIIKDPNIQNKLSTEILNQELCKGNTASVSLNTNAEEINWYNQQNELVGNGKTLEINKANNYYAISRIGECYKTSDWVFYKENEKPTASLIANSQDINIGQKATFQLKFSGNPPFEFVINDTLKLNATGNDYTYSFVPIYNGEYKVTSVKNTCGLGIATGKAQIQVLLANETSDFSDKISIFPNPSFEFVSIQSQLLKPNDVKIELYNSQGKLINEEKILKAKEINAKLDMQKLPSGIYNIRIQVGDSVYSRKIVKN